MKQITLKEWTTYRDLLSKLSAKASDELRDFVFVQHRGLADLARQDIIDYAFALITKYGEGAGALAAQFYDDLAELSHVMIPPAQVADLPSYQETAIAINGSLKQSPTGQKLEQVASRLVKQVAADTTLQNAERDGAQFAWVPSGDTCAFCIALASRGWQYMSSKALRSGHAEHIHAHCDCQYAVRFNSRTTVAGYDPNKYKDMYYGAEGKTPEQKINSMRRKFYAENKAIVGPESSVAEELIAKATNRTEAYSVLSTMFGSISDNVKTIDESLLVDNVNRLNELNAKFKVINADNMGYFTASPSGKAVAWTSTSFRNGRQDTKLSLVNRYYKQEGTLVDESTRGRETFFSMPFADEYIKTYTITHEYGHILESYVTRNRIDFDAFNARVSMYNPALQAKELAKQEKKEAKTIFNEIVDIAKQKNPDFSMADNLSKYGHTNYYEFFAEVFANSQCGAPNELGDAMNEWLKKEGF